MRSVGQVRGYLLITLGCLLVTTMMYNFLWREPFQVLYLEYSDDVDAPAQVLSKELVVRRVLLDPRRRSGHISIAVLLWKQKERN